MIQSTDIVYIAGPMTGRKLYNYPKFYGMAGVIQKTYHCEVLNPARQPDGLPYEEYIRRGMSDVSRATVIVLLKGWSYSNGALSEWREASERGIRILLEDQVLDAIQKLLKQSNPGIPIGGKEK